MVRLAFVLLFLAAFAVLHLPAKADECRITFAVSNDFPPFQFRDVYGEWHGIAVELAENMVTAAGCRIEILDLPWQRAVDMLKKGELHMLPLITAHPQRERFMHFIGPMGLEQIVFVAQRHLAQSISKPGDLKTFPALIGKTKGTEYADKIEKLIASAEVQARIVNNVSDANKIEMLMIERIGGAFEERAVAEYYFHHEILDPELHEICLTFLPNPVYFGLSVKSMDRGVLPHLRGAWRTMLQEGKVEGIYAKYGINMPDITNLDFPQY